MSWGSGESHERVDLTLREQRDRLLGGVSHPGDVLAWVEADVGEHAREKDVLRPLEPPNADGLPLEIAQGAHALGREQLVAAGVHAGQDGDRSAGVETQDQRTGEVHVDARLAGGEGVGDRALSVLLDVPHVGEALTAQEVLRDVLRRLAHARRLQEDDPRRLRWRLRVGRPGPSGQRRHRGGRPHTRSSSRRLIPSAPSSAR